MAAGEPVAFGVLLSRLRLAVGLTQEELAERSGLSVEAISTLERGVTRRPRPTTIRQLLEALQLSTEDRASLEQAAIARNASADVDEPRPFGAFLGALPATRIVGRQEERDRICSILDVAAQGAGQFLLLAGELGAGKTRMLQEVTVQADSRGYLVLPGRCYKSEQASAFYPVVEALSRADRILPSSVRLEWQRGWKRIRPLLAGRSRDDAIPGGTIQTQQEAFGAVSDLLVAVTRAVPVAFLLDDLQWADVSTLKLLRYLAHVAPNARLLLAGAFLDHRLIEAHPELSDTIQALVRERLVERLTIRRLSLEETGQLVGATMSQEKVSEEFASFVYRRTKGNPRLIDGLVRSLGGRLELQGEIGAGAMGRVFRAYDRTLDRTVAAKLVLCRTEIDLDTLLRFQQEGAVLSKLDHLHIVRIYDTFAEEHATCIIMESLDGESIGQILRAGPLPLPRARHLAMQVTEALSYAHSQQIVHRDIKPDNVIVLVGDRVKVTDFGIARLLQPDTSLQTIATTGMRMGTPLYMAPEQIEGKKIDGRTDIYGLGATLYHMVTGRPPFEGSDALTVAVKHLQEEPLPPSRVNSAIPATWDAVILKAMAKDPAQRYQTAGECQQAIAGLPTELAPHGEQRRSARGAHAHPTASALPSLKQAWTSTRAPFRLVGALTSACLLVTALWLHALSPKPSAAAHRLLWESSAVWGVKIPTFKARFAPQIGVALSTPVHNVMYLGDANSDAILRVSTAGKLLAAWEFQGTRPGEVDGVNGIAVDTHGNLYVADDGHSRIDKFAPDGRFLTSFGRQGFNAGEFFRPGYVAVDPHGIIYVADTYNDRIQKLSPTGKPLLLWGSPGKLPGQVHGPSYIKLDARGDVYVIEHVNNRIQKFSAEGRSLAIIGGPGNGPEQFTNSQGMGFDSHGNMYVLDHTLSRVQVFTPRGTLLRVWGTFGSRPGEFKQPWDLAIDAQDHVYVADAGNDRIQMLTTRGKPLAQWSIRSLLHPLFQRPTYAVVDRHGDLYVSDARRDAVDKLSDRGDLLHHWGRRGNGSGQFRGPSGVALDAAGNVYVADSGNSRIQEFTPRGQFVTAWPVRIHGTKRPSVPTGLAIAPDGRLYVSDPVNGVVEGYSRPGVLRIQWGWSNPSHPMYRLKDPTGIAVDRHGNVYVADSGNHRVVEFAAADLRGTDLPEGHATASWGGGAKADRMIQPIGVAVDASGNSYVTDAATSRVQVFAPGGKLVAGWGSYGSGPGDFQDPTGIALDAAGNVYIADSGNSRIQKFRPVR